MNAILKTFTVAAMAVTFVPVQAQSTAPTPASTPALAAEARWVCTAQNLASARYTGGDWANIHLAQYSSGGSYKIIEKTELVAKGVTKDGTPFECKKTS
ncbi:MAG: hypothetical protein V4542_03055 [Pseudomonadota bacterium]